jgi:hypothetical protein
MYEIVKSVPRVTALSVLESFATPRSARTRPNLDPSWLAS